MVKLGVCTANLSVTRMGYKCLMGDMDITGAVLVEVGTRLGVEAYAKVAAAFIACGLDLFSNPHAGVKQVVGLTAKQLALASKYGDVHTAVKWFLKWCPKLSLPDHLESLFNIMCFRKMHAALYRKRGYFALPNNGAANYEIRLLVAIAFAKQKSIVCRHGNTCVTSHMDKDERRENLAFLNAEVKISERSVCYLEEMQDNPSWLVYVSTGRYPFVKSVTVLPTNIAAWFSHFSWPQDYEFDFAVVFRSLLYDPRRIDSLSEFVTLLGGGHVADEMVMLTDEGDAAEQHRAAITSNDEAPYVRCPHALLIRVREILNDDCDVSTSELVQVLKRIARDTPRLACDAKRLVDAVIRVDAPFQRDTTRKDLVAILMMVLRNRLEGPKKRKRIKTFVYRLHVEALQNLRRTRHLPGEIRTLSLVDQEVLLRRALRGGGVGDNEESETTSAMEGIDRVSSKIANTKVVEGNSQIWARKARKRMNKVRQRVCIQSFTPMWVVHDQVIDEVILGGVTDVGEAEVIAQRIWKEVCFLPDIYRTEEGDQATRAEFICQWLRAGISWDDCITYLKSLRLVKDSKRECPWTFREASMKRLKHNISQTYSPRGQQCG